mmetsp:Transcript_54941/g.118731  ORF Transcript_54941/g.118731 Transcript_54941/m.118731 type:complete len:309 (+) Transcript_54941:962-1888(+)
MTVSGDHEINAVLVSEALPVFHILAVVRPGLWREMRHDDLPICSRSREFLVEPQQLICPELPEPGDAVPVVARAEGEATRPTVAPTTDVVHGICIRVRRVLVVRVDNVDVDAEALRRVLDVLVEVLARHHPPVRGPGVGELLIPAVVEQIAAVVVVSQAAQPRHAINARPMVDLVEDVVELRRALAPAVAELGHADVHRLPALLLDASPVEVVTSIEHVAWPADVGQGVELLRHEVLSHVVDPPSESSPILHVRSRPEMASPAPDAAPVSDDEGVLLLQACEAELRPADAVVVGSDRRQRRDRRSPGT